MQFVRNGPDIPERLLQAHEDGRVVFFCGAGISRPVLPDFGGLVKELYAQFGGATNQCQKEAIKRKQYDIAVELLEAGNVDGRMGVRQKLAGILKVPTNSNRDTAHESLLTLSKNRKGTSMQLVTTNFDLLFEETIVRLYKKAVTNKQQQVKRFQAPLLPIPNKQWNGLVYLHGLLPEDPTPGELPKDSTSELNNLVISSGDFGLAYLTERWAARFVSELFRNYIVCFVGYSLDDPVLRYMTDAFAADRQQGGSPQEIFAFGNYSGGEEEKQGKEWEDKNVTPILYLKGADKDNQHFLLHKTLQSWSKTYRAGVEGKERIVAKYAIKHPAKSTKEDDFVSRVIWTLRDPSGIPAKHFAELNPMPSLAWLPYLSNEHYRQADLDPSGISTEVVFDDGDTSNLLYRPPQSKWNEMMWRLAPWLTRHLNDPTLFLWMANQHNSLRRILVNPIESQLNKLSRLERDGNTAELDRIRSVPSRPMRTLWRLLLTGCVLPNLNGSHFSVLIPWKVRFKRYGLTSTLRTELLECLTPRVLLNERIISRAKDAADHKPEHINELGKLEIVLLAGNVLKDLKELTKNDQWVAALPELLAEFSSLLRNALDLMRKLGGASDRINPSYTLRPSISEHAQNINPHDWTALIDLTRNAWLSVAEQSPERARCVAEDWPREHYLLFRRLAFFAAAQGEAIPCRQGLNWLLADEHQWLWSPETKRETMRLLVALAP